MVTQLHASPVINIPVTYYPYDILTAPEQEANALYFQIDACKQGIANQKKAQLSIILKDNVHWNTTSSKGYVVVQVSKCKDSFTPQCVFAQNYKPGAHYEAIPVISWDLSITNETTYYLRVMAPLVATLFSMELSFGNDYSGESYPYVDDQPFNSEKPATSVQLLSQYWRSDAQYNVYNDDRQPFFLAFCPQPGITGINVATTTLPNPTDQFLAQIQQWACSNTTTTLDNCTPTNNQWHHKHVAGVDILLVKYCFILYILQP